ncbi:hypothetical protein ACM43_10850 [Bradyrhizobium sp. CCBAU 45321]|nr:hypothetical protein [Bradyrhizobium sp. CCBAU 45321]
MTGGTGRPEDGAIFVVELVGTEENLPVIKGEPAVPPEGRRLNSWNELRRDHTPEAPSDDKPLCTILWIVRALEEFNSSRHRSP